MKETVTEKEKIFYQSAMNHPTEVDRLIARVNEEIEISKIKLSALNKAKAQILVRGGK